MNFHDNLQSKIDTYTHLVYKISKDFPKEEQFGITSQLRRSSLSVALNYIEGYARIRSKVYKNFLQIAYGSLKESSYLIEFSYIEKFIPKKEYEELKALADEIGAMLWSIQKTMK